MEGEQMKVCSACGEEKSEADFYADKTRPDYLHPQCRACSAARKRASNRRIRTQDPETWARRRRGYVARYKTRHPERMKRHWRKQQLRKHGITPEEFDEMAADQRGLCLVCEEKPERLYVDHDHATGKVRGLLCVNCNFALGHAKDSIEILHKLVRYLKR